MKTFEDALIWAWAAFALVVMVWACRRDGQAVLDYYAETGGDDLAIPADPDPGATGNRAQRPDRLPGVSEAQSSEARRPC